MKTITGKTKAWLTTYEGPEVLEGSPDLAIRSLHFAQHDMTGAGWTLVGNATITIECPDRQQLVDNKITALRGELQTVRAEAEMKCGDLELKIQKLLAITCEVTV